MLHVYRPPAEPTPEQLVLEELKDRTHQRLLEHSEEDETSGCVVWLGAWHPQKGTGCIRVAGRLYSTHRVAAWVYIGGFELDDPDVSIVHTGCRWPTPACICHDHLSIVRGGRQAVARLLAELGRTKGFRRRAHPAA